MTYANPIFEFFIGVNSIALQIIFVIILTLNTVVQPWIIKLTRRKKKKILDKDVNTSYSRISIRILNTLILNSIV